VDSRNLLMLQEQREQNGRPLKTTTLASQRVKRRRPSVCVHCLPNTHQASLMSLPKMAMPSRIFSSGTVAKLRRKVLRLTSLPA